MIFVNNEKANLKDRFILYVKPRTSHHGTRNMLLL